MDTHNPQDKPKASESKAPPSRLYLKLKAIFWRVLMQFGMYLHRLPAPRPNPVAFTRHIPTTLSSSSGIVTIYFYTPKNYKVQQKLGTDDKRYPVVINFHGGGFTIGRATDDARWATQVAEQTQAVVASVDYRLAPEYPFPTAIEDGVDSVLYIIRHAEELQLDPKRIALSGFSAGGNMAFTVPLRLLEETDPKFKQGDEGTHIQTTKGDLVSVSRNINTSQTTSPQDLPGTSSHDVNPVKLPPYKIVAISSWYPSTDYTLTREQRNKTILRQDMAVPDMFTSLFDAAYLTPAGLDRKNPYLSPGKASDELLKLGLPHNIYLYTCEWDMLRSEAMALRDRLQGLGKNVVHEDVKEAPHSFDKKPYPFEEAHQVKGHYRSACKQLRIAFGDAEETGTAGSTV